MKDAIEHSVFYLVITLTCFFTNLALQANPFAIDFPPKEMISNEDYLFIQKQLRTIDVAPLVKELYPADPTGYTTYIDFLNRCSRGIRQTLINPEKGQFPSKHLEQIGSRSDMCFVTCIPYDYAYPALIKKIPDALRKAGYNGFFLYFIGGFPNPTGNEIRYVGVPYSFKIFMMLEAQKLGFNRVIWIDSAALPLRDPTPLFDCIEKNEALLIHSKKAPDTGSYVLPATRELLKSLTGTDVLETNFLRTIVFGLKMNAPRVRALIEAYYACAELGTPFLSCFPEEFVLTAIIGQKEYQSWWSDRFKLLKSTDGNDTPSKFKKAKKDGFYFYHLQH